MSEFGIREDDDQPITHEWVEAEFGSRVMNSCVKHENDCSYGVISIICMDEGVKICIDPHPTSSIASLRMPWIKTRGDLRLLLRAFKWERPE